MRILIIDTNRHYAQSLGSMLEGEGFAFDHMDSLTDASASLDSASYDAMLIERCLPDGDGADWIRHQRRLGSTVPMLIVAGQRDSVGDRVEGLNAGADDYMVKPVPTDELVARIRAVLRRPASVLDPLLKAGNIAFDPSNREVRVGRQTLRLPRRETAILEILMRRVGRIVTKNVLEQGLYSFGGEVSSNAIEVGVYRLRNHLVTAGASVAVRTVRGSGYSLEALDEQGNAVSSPANTVVAA